MPTQAHTVLPVFDTRTATLARCALAAAALCSTAALSQEAGQRPLWELGGLAVGASQQAYPGADKSVGRVLALPYFVYRGEVLRADRGSVGLRAMKTPEFEVDVGFSGSFGSSSNSIPARQGMKNLGTLIELGPRLKWNLATTPDGGAWRAEFPLRAVLDVSDGAAFKGLSFEPELQYGRRLPSGWSYSVSAGAMVGNKSLNRTFYEVSSAEATLLRPSYAANGGLIGWRLATSFSRNLTPDWRVFGVVRMDTVAGSANQKSPLVRQTSGATLGLGVAYTWMRSKEMSRD